MSYTTSGKTVLSAHHCPHIGFRFAKNETPYSILTLFYFTKSCFISTERVKVMGIAEFGEILLVCPSNVDLDLKLCRRT